MTSLFTRGVPSRIVAVSDAAVAEAIRIYYRDIHNLAEGAGAARWRPLMPGAHAHGGQEGGVIPVRREHRHRLVPDRAGGRRLPEPR